MSDRHFTIKASVYVCGGCVQLVRVGDRCPCGYVPERRATKPLTVLAVDHKKRTITIG